MWKTGRIKPTLRDGAVTGRRDKGGKLAIGDRVWVDEKAFDAYLRHRSFLRVVAVGTHLERAARDPDHISGVATERRGLIRLQSTLHAVVGGR